MRIKYFIKIDQKTYFGSGSSSRWICPSRTRRMHNWIIPSGPWKWHFEAFFSKKTCQMSRIKGSKSNICTSRPPQNGPGVRVSVTDSRFCTKVLLEFLCNAWYTSIFWKNSQNIDVNFEDFVTNLYYLIWSLLATININFLNFQSSFSKFLHF